MADVNNARIWTGAEVWVADYGSTAPTDLTTALDAAFKELGLLTQDDGISSEHSETETEHYAYGNTLVRTSKTKAKDQFKMVAMEDTDLVFHLANPGSESATATGVTTRIRRPRNYGLAIKAVVLELVDGTVAARRYFPRVQFAQTGGGTLTDNAITGREFTATILGDTIGGSLGLDKEWTNDTGAAVV